MGLRKKIEELITGLYGDEMEHVAKGAKIMREADEAIQQSQKSIKRYKDFVEKKLEDEEGKE